MKIGIPRGLLYYLFEDLWLGFFDNLGIETLLSPISNKQIIKNGVNNSIDEACYSSKLYIGHVQYLIDKCDMIFVPRLENSGIREDYCTRIFGVYDFVRGTFPTARLLHANVNYLYRKRESDAFIEVGVQLNKTKEESLVAYEKALAVFNQKRAEKIAKQNKLLEDDGLKVLIVSHAYNTYDAVIGGEVVKYFENLGIKVAYADVIDSKSAKQKAKAVYGNRIYWKVNAELMGGVEEYKDKVDGIILISTFPCGPDSIFNELIIRTVKDKPILSLIIDEQDAKAGLVTRLESFTDIITAKRGI